MFRFLLGPSSLSANDQVYRFSLFWAPEPPETTVRTQVFVVFHVDARNNTLSVAVSRGWSVLVRVVLCCKVYFPKPGLVNELTCLQVVNGSLCLWSNFTFFCRASKVMLVLHPDCPTSSDPYFTYMEDMTVFGASAPLRTLFFCPQPPCIFSAFFVSAPSPHPTSQHSPSERVLCLFS